MPITVSKMATNTASVTVTDGADSAQVVYYPGRVSEKSIALMNSFASIDGNDVEAVTSGFHAFNEELARLISSWEVLQEDGSMFPLDAERLAELPIVFRVSVLGAILSDLHPNQGAPQTNPTQN